MIGQKAAGAMDYLALAAGALMIILILAALLIGLGIFKGDSEHDPEDPETNFTDILSPPGYYRISFEAADWSGEDCTTTAQNFPTLGLYIDGAETPAHTWVINKGGPADYSNPCGEPLSFPCLDFAEYSELVKLEAGVHELELKHIGVSSCDGDPKHYNQTQVKNFHIKGSWPSNLEFIGACGVDDYIAWKPAQHNSSAQCCSRSWPKCIRLPSYDFS